jgi:Bacterial regulatory proteins, tetR family
MGTHPQVSFVPRKTPVQARSAATVEAIFEATIQVLLEVGPDLLTTTRVAERAGVSKGFGPSLLEAGALQDRHEAPPRRRARLGRVVSGYTSFSTKRQTR